MKLLLFFIILVFPSISSADQYSSALDSAQQAAYKQTGLENMINNYTQEQLKHIPKPVQTVGGNILLVAKVLRDRKIEVKWSFQ